MARTATPRWPTYPSRSMWWTSSSTVKFAGGVADDAVAAGARAVWFQLGVVDTEAYDRTRAAGLDMVMDRCPAIEIPALSR